MIFLHGTCGDSYEDRREDVKCIDVHCIISLKLPCNAEDFNFDSLCAGDEIEFPIFDDGTFDSDLIKVIRHRNNNFTKEKRNGSKS